MCPPSHGLRLNILICSEFHCQCCAFVSLTCLALFSVTPIQSVDPSQQRRTHRRNCRAWPCNQACWYFHLQQNNPIYFPDLIRIVRKFCVLPSIQLKIFLSLHRTSKSGRFERKQKWLPKSENSCTIGTSSSRSSQCMLILRCPSPYISFNRKQSELNFAWGAQNSFNWQVEITFFTHLIKRSILESFTSIILVTTVPCVRLACKDLSTTLIVMVWAILACNRHEVASVQFDK